MRFRIIKSKRLLSFLIFFFFCLNLTVWNSVLLAADGWDMAGDEIFSPQSSKVGVGISSPSERLTVFDGEISLKVASNTHQQGLVYQNMFGNYAWRIYRANSGGGNASLHIAGGQHYSDYTELDDRITITEEGKLGINTNNPSEILTVYDGEFALQTGSNLKDQSILFQNKFGDYTWRIYRTDSGGANADLRIAGGPHRVDFNNLPDRLSITEEGRLGIGLNNPQYKLDVDGVINASAIKVAGTDVLTSEDDPQVGSISSNLVPYWNGSSLVGGTISDDGSKVGVGTANPSEKLEVQGNLKVGGKIKGDSEGNVIIQLGN